MSNQDFGPNQWLVDEMYQQYKDDPASVDQEWRDYFNKGSIPTPEPHAAANSASSPAAAAPSPAATPQNTAPEKKEQPVNSAPQPTDIKPELKELRGAEREVVDLAMEKSPLKKIQPTPPAGEAVMKGVAKATAKNMNISLQVPTATSVREMPARLMFENRAVINGHLKRTSGRKISFTHIIGWAVIKAVQIHPDMNNYYKEEDGKAYFVTPEHINLGLAVDTTQKNGERALVVAAIKEAETLTFDQFLEKYEDIVKRSREGALTLEDYQGVTISLTNPGGIGTTHSVPRLMQGQGTIVGVGSMKYPAEFDGASTDRLAELGVGKLVTITSTYDHRIIQGAESGEFLGAISDLLVDDAFWNEIFDALEIPYAPIRWAQDVPNTGIDKNTRVAHLIEAYRSRGHLIANTNPLNWHQPGVPMPDHSDLTLEAHGLTMWDLDRTFSVGGFGGKEQMTLREVIQRLRDAYTLTVGSEYMHVMDKEERTWLQDKIEAGIAQPDHKEMIALVQLLNAAEAFEMFLQTKYIGQKRFSLEGAESMIPLMDAVIDEAATEGLDEVTVGMPHRGRLNVLANIVGKPLAQIFKEFEGNINPASPGGSGDVKYHLGAQGTHIQMFGDNEIKVTLSANPSHLETVDAVQIGSTRAKQDLLDKGRSEDGFSVLPLQLHGDASFAGLGVVQETLNMAQLSGYAVGGTVHVVVNNQVGFTTTPDSGRSTTYSTDLGKAYGCPIFHVNADDPEAVVWVGKLATEYRRRWGKDVFIDLIAYRRRGHNEADDPSMTQPELYQRIDNHKSTRTIYVENLLGKGKLSDEEFAKIEEDFHDQLEAVFNQVRASETSGPAAQTGIAASQELTHLDTNVTKEELLRVGNSYANIPEDFHMHPRVAPVAERRVKAVSEGGIDWAWAELLAFGSLAGDGKIVRLAGEDSQRGTYSQRHSVLNDQVNFSQFNPIDAYARSQGNGGKFMVYNSPLTEYAGMGFEYGYSIGNPDALVAWEAQYGDFANGGQTIIDEYLSSAEAKWGIMSSLILLLPHGYEGSGPDHSSARIERYLQLCAEGSMTLAQPTVPSNYFHLLRRQGLGEMRRPLVVFSPKSMLRNKMAVSAPEEFTEVKRFRSVINDPRFVDIYGNLSGDPSTVTTVLFTSGKFYYDLEKKRAKDGRDDVAIIRLEMLHPIPYNRIKDAFALYPNAKDYRWVQEEPANQGPWPFLHEYLPELVPELKDIKRVSRRAQSAPSTGVTKVHAIETKALLDEAFA